MPISYSGVVCVLPVTQWEVPKELQAAATVSPASVAPTTSTGALSQPPSSTAAGSQQPVKRSSEEAGLEKTDTHRPPKRTGPYGGWTTVAVIEREPEEENKVGEAGETEEEVEDTEQKEQFQFEEKKISGGLAAEEEEGSGELKGEFRGFSFKKRLNKGRPQIRQRTSDF